MYKIHGKVPESVPLKLALVTDLKTTKKGDMLLVWSVSLLHLRGLTCTEKGHHKQK